MSQPDMVSHVLGHQQEDLHNQLWGPVPACWLTGFNATFLCFHCREAVRMPACVGLPLRVHGVV